MSNPVVTAIPVSTWTIIATNVTFGHVWNLDTSATYYQAYRVTGDPAPTNQTESVALFPDGVTHTDISSPTGIDVYVYATGAPGLLRVDL